MHLCKVSLLLTGFLVGGGRCTGVGHGADVIGSQQTETETEAEAEAEAAYRYRLAFGSCNNPRFPDIWSVVASTSPDSLLLLGDNMYADTRSAWGTFEPATPETLAKKYNDVAQNINFQSLVDTIGGYANLVATYDDHDYGINDGDKTFVHRNASMGLFWDFVHAPENSPRRVQNGVYSSKLFEVAPDFNVKVLALDVRSNKDPKHTIHGDFLGAEQWYWLEKELHDVDEVDLIVLGSSVQVLPDGKALEESWHEYPHARERLLRLITEAQQFVNIVLVSGDIHAAEILKASCKGLSKQQQSLWEFTSSGFTHTATFSTRTPNEAEVSENASPVAISPRNSYRWFYYYYQAFVATYYRENKYGDHFDGINFGLLDVVHNTKKNAFAVIVRIMNYRREVAIEKHVQLRQRSELLQQRLAQKDESYRYHSYDAGFPNPEDTRSVCHGVHGDLPLWRMLLTRAALLGPPFLVVVVPMFIALWFVIASAFYAIYGAEERRRERLMKAYNDKIKQQ